MADIDTMIARIRKLLAKAESTTSEAEAEACQAKAAELLATYRIDAARIHVLDPDGNALTIVEIDVGRGAYVRARLALLQAVSAASDCSMAFVTGHAATVGHVAGTVNDTRSVMALYHALHSQAATHMSRTRKATGAATQRWRRSFLFGFADRINTMLIEARQSAMKMAADADQRDGRSVELELAARAERARIHLEHRFGRVRAARAPGAATATGWADGHAAAGAADVGRPRLPGGPRALGRGAA